MQLQHFLNTLFHLFSTFITRFDQGQESWWQSLHHFQQQITATIGLDTKHVFFSKTLRKATYHLLNIKHQNRGQSWLKCDCGNHSIFSRKFFWRKDEGSMVHRSALTFCTLISFFFYGQMPYWMLEYSHKTSAYQNEDLISRCESICKNRVYTIGYTHYRRQALRISHGKVQHKEVRKSCS